MKFLKFLAVLPAALLAVPAAAHAATPWQPQQPSTPCDPAGSALVATALTDRPDSGGSGTWAYDTISRTFAYKLVSDAGIYLYSGVLCDTGTFTTVPFALAPNQGAPHIGEVMAGSVTGQITGGYNTFTFSSATPADPALMPSSQPGAGFSTSDWPAQLFSGPSSVTENNDWTWTYTVAAHGVFLRQQWTDAFSNDGGQVPAAGQIAGS